GNVNVKSLQKILSQISTLPVIHIDGASIPEGDAGPTDARVTLHLSAPSVDVARVNWTTLDGSAVGGEDYEPASGVVTFEAGETSRTVTIAILGDTKPEDDESFFVQLSNPINAVLATERAMVVIRNDDAT